MRPAIHSYSLIEAYCCVGLNPRSMTSVGTFGGSFFENLEEGPAFPSIWVSSLPEDEVGCVIDCERELFRCGCSEDSAALCDMYWEKIASAAANVASSFFGAGVPVLDLERLADLPKDPVSATTRRGLDTF